MGAGDWERFSKLQNVMLNDEISFLISTNTTFRYSDFYAKFTDRIL